MNKPANHYRAKRRSVTQHLLPIVALGSGLVATPAIALELGDLTVQSSLGQPLRASIAYALAPHEALSEVCVAVNAGRTASGLPGIGKSSLSITDRAIVITGATSIREPMLATRVTINCPYTPNISREYMLFLDPADTTPGTQSVARTAPAPVASTNPRPQLQRATTANPEPIGRSARYRVQPGDTLSEIVQRIENRSMKLWPAINAVFAANPDAFIDNNPNILKAGSWLTIPSLDGSEPVVAIAPAATRTAVEKPVADAPTRAGEAAASAVYQPVALDNDAAPVAEAAVVEDMAVIDNTSDLRPGDPVLANETPDVEFADAIVIPDTKLEGPEASSSSPNVPTAIISTGSRNESTSLFAWLIGGGLVVLGGLVLFGRRLRDRFESTPVSAAAVAPLAPAHGDTTQVEADIDYDLADDSPTEENLALDANLEIGTGLDDGTDMEVANDFGFAAASELDAELPFEPVQSDSENETDVIPPPRPEVASILESEVLPEENDDYDMSVIMDATKMPQPEDVTERDLMAVEVDPIDTTLNDDAYTINREVAYNILEQDYEQELTATQALNAEIARAAAELAGDHDRTGDGDRTEALPRATVTELDITAQMPATDEDAVAEAQPGTSDTGAVTVNITADDKTAEMPAADNDETAEMEIESGKSGGKAS